MIENLRKKFIIIFMFVVAVVILICFVCILFFNYQESLILADNQLSQAIDMAASGQKDIYRYPFNKPKTSNQSINMESDFPNIPIAVCSLSSNGSIQVTLAGISRGEITEESLYETFSQVVNTNDGLNINPELGIIYRKDKINATVYVAMTNINSVSNWQELLIVFIPVFIIIMGIFFIISLWLSKWALKPVEVSLNQQKRFVEDASHDLKTPISVILANNSILEDSASDKQIQWVDSTRQEANKMLKMVNDMLDLSKAQYIDNPEDQDVFSISNLIEGTQLSFESLAFDKGIEIQSNIEKDIYIKANKKETEKILMTLFTNAFVHANNPDKVSVYLDPGEFCINNRNTSIAKEDLEHIFERFYKTDKSRNDSKSHGLGLAIAKSLAEKNRLNLYCKSTKETGTSFYIKFKTHKKLN